MGLFSRFESKVENTIEGAGNKMFDAAISPVQIAKKAEKVMRRERIVGAGRQYAPTLYTVLVNEDDDERLFGYYPTLAGETETYLSAKSAEAGLVMDGQPLVRFVVDESLKRGKFDVIAEPVAAPIIKRLRQEEMARYGLAASAQMAAPAAPYPSVRASVSSSDQSSYGAAYQTPAQAVQAAQVAQVPTYSESNHLPGQPLPYVPEEELDRSIDYGEYTFNSEEFDDNRQEHKVQDSFPFQVQDSLPFKNSLPFQAQDSLPFQAEGAPRGVKLAGDAASRAASSAADAVAVAAASPLPNATATPNIAAAYHGGVPNTAVFATGQGNASPVPQQEIVRARLINMTENRTYDLAIARILIGRDVKNTITIDDINASRTHAELRFEPQGVWVISDLGSTNGTYVNGREVTSQVLSPNDKISIGMTTFVFTYA